jgi:prepilin-type N-terminal cleavage/methylation domain-containing protein
MIPGAATLRRSSTGFTLIELMVAISIAALMMMVAIPAFRATRKPPLIRAANDFIEACRQARARAVLTGFPMDVLVSANDRTTELSVVPVPGGPGPSNAANGPASAAVSSAPLFHAEFPEDVAFRTFIVNQRNAVSGFTEAAAVRFFPNGTSDQLDAELQWQRREVLRFRSDLVTGIVEVEAVQ